MNQFIEDTTMDGSVEFPLRANQSPSGLMFEGDSACFKPGVRSPSGMSVRRSMKFNAGFLIEVLTVVSCGMPLALRKLGAPRGNEGLR